MSNVRLATGGTWKTDTKEWRPKGGRGFYEKQRRPAWRLVPVCVLIAVAVASLSIKKRREPKHNKPPKLHHLAPPIADPLAKAALDLSAGADARLTFTQLLPEEDRSYLNETPTDQRGRAKGRMSAADRALVLALLGRPGGSYHPGKVRGVRRTGRSIVKKNCLVFGLPGDGKRWTDAGHRLVFLDHRDDAVRTARDEGLNAYVVRYASAPKSSWEASPYTTDPKRLVIDAPSYDFRDEAHIFWDLIIVDGPDSVQKESSGRAAPVARAAEIVRRQAASHPDRRVDVLVHDAHRSHELELGLAYLSPLAAFANYRALRGSRAPNSTSEVRFAWFARAPP